MCAGPFILQLQVAGIHYEIGTINKPIPLENIA